MYELKRVHTSPSDMHRQLERDFTQIEFAKGLFSMLYPLKTVKRFIYRPMLGRWYPHIDVDIPSFDIQLGFFFENICISFSRDRFCCKCGVQLSENFQLNNVIPISLCPGCSKKIFYEYWSCLYNIIYSDLLQINILKNNFDNNFKNNLNKNEYNPIENIQKSICEDFLNPRCGYPLDGDYVNPCLKNHGIGLILVDTMELKIIVGLIDSLKYQMIWQGGLFGIILGFTDRIMTLEKLRDLFPNLCLKISEEIKNDLCGNISSFNNSDTELEKIKYLDLRLEGTIMTVRTVKTSDIVSVSSISSVLKSFMINFLDYYPNFSIQHFLSKYFGNILIFLRLLLEKVILEFNFEIIDFLELYNAYPPINRDLRSNLEQEVKNKIGITEMSQLTTDHLLKLMSFDIDCVKGVINPTVVASNKLTNDFEINRILWSMGPYIFSNSSISEKICVLNLYDLLGRRIS